MSGVIETSDDKYERLLKKPDIDPDWTPFEYEWFQKEKQKRFAASRLLSRLSPIHCAECNWPVAHLDARVRGALAGGMCTRDTCVRDRKTGLAKRVYTYHRVPSDLEV